MPELSVLIPSRREQFLARTIQDVLEKMRGDTEVIAVCDEVWADPPITNDTRVRIIYEPNPVGQRRGTNEAATLSRAEFVMKLDAHCAMDEGFDVKLLAPYRSGELGADVTTIPIQFNLHAFNFVCNACGDKTYQGPTPKVCAKCKAEAGFSRDMQWRPRLSRKTEFWRFDHDLHFQYWHDFRRRPVARGTYPEVMSCLGACWLMRRDRYWQLGGMDEQHGSWGNMGTEVACKSWLSGGRMVTNKRTWFAHMFRTTGGDFGFPYKITGHEQDLAREYSRNLWLNNRWPGQVRPLAWLIERFAPLPGWHEPQGAARLAQVTAAGFAFAQQGNAAQVA